MKTSLLLIILSVIALIFVVAYTNNTTMIICLTGFIIILLIIYFSKNDKYLSGIKNADVSTKLDRDVLLDGDTNVSTVNYTHSIWFNITDFCGNHNDIGSSGHLLKSNQVNIDLEQSGDLSITINPNDQTSHGADEASCLVYSYPLQTWVNLIVSRYQKIVDVYLDGKLVRTCHVNNNSPTELSSSNAVEITPNGGFVGQTANYLYINNSINPQKAYDIYRDGAGGKNLFSNLISKYKLKISYLVDNVEQNSLTI